MQHNNIVHLTPRILLYALAGILLVSCVPTTGEFEPQVSEPPGSDANTGYPAPMQEESYATLGAYPAPNASSQEAYPASNERLSQPIGQETTPWPTFTPFPSPTHQPGPTPTALPLREPHQNATGTITYLERQGGTLLAPSRITTTALGEILTPPELLSTENARINLAEPVSMYPSPDGKYILLTDGWGVRYIFDSDTGQYRPLFQNMLDPKGQSFNWHPDSKHFLMEAEDGSKDTGLWLVNVETGEYSVLLHQFPTPHIIAGDISPNGQHVIYALDSNENREQDLDAVEAYEVWLADINGDNALLIWESSTYVGIFAWSPDGRHVAMNDGRIMDMQNYTVTTLTNDMANGYGYAFRPVWSPDSRQIAFIAFDDPNPITDNTLLSEGYEIDIFKGTNIHILDIEAGKERTLLQGTGHIYPAWSPDGSHIAFTSNMNGKSEIWAVNLNGTDLRQLTNSQGPALFPYWTPFSNEREQ